MRVLERRRWTNSRTGGRSPHWDVEARLRSARPEPPEQLVRMISTRVRTTQRARLRPLRIAAALASTVLAAGVAGWLGAPGYAAAAAKKAASAVALAVTPASPPSISNTPATKVTICHATGSSTNPFVEITVSGKALPAHVGHGDLATVPPQGCPGPTPGNAQYKRGKGCGDKNHVHAREGTCPFPAK